ncbi:hypothetical protein AAVH_16339 [Aphelenchoides avenae]|nr:hypothetical protein AAVH_16339 [Aphelenchus avenae]
MEVASVTSSVLADTSNLLIGDGHFFWNARPTRHISERICFGFSVVANTVLAVLLVREKNPAMKPYSRVLLLNAVFDYIYTVICMIVEVVNQ